MKYRIVKRYHKGKNQKTISYYIIQYLDINRIKSIFYFKKYYQWYDYKELEFIYTRIVSKVKSFSSQRKAKKYIENLKEPVYDDEVL